MSCCKYGGHFWSRVEKTIARPGIGFRNSEMEADSHILNRVFHNALYEQFLKVSQEFSKYVCTSQLRKSRNRFNLIKIRLNLIYLFFLCFVLVHKNIG
jgi:hypothetical protein